MMDLKRVSNFKQVTKDFYSSLSDIKQNFCFFDILVASYVIIELENNNPRRSVTFVTSSASY
jgi:hypothetical protein